MRGAARGRHACIALVPLVLVLYYLLSKGLGAWSWHFFTTDPTGNVPRRPGRHQERDPRHDRDRRAGHAIAVRSASASRSTSSSTAASGWFADAVRYFVDVMTGVPSIVFGLFVYITLVLVGSGGSASPAGRARSRWRC